MTTRKKHSRIIEKKKESRDAALTKGTEEILALGIDLGSLEPTAASVEKLSQIRPPSPEAERAIACWLGFAEIPESAGVLAEMEERARDKELRREIRRSLFRLEQKGVAVPRRPSEPAASPLLAREEDRGYLSHLDGRGDQVIWYVRAELGGDYYVLSGVVNDRRGLLEADAGHVTRPAFRDLLERTRTRFSLRMLPADAAYCDLLLHESYRASAARRNPGVSRFPSFRMVITHRVPERVPCPVHAALGDDAVVGDPAFLEGSVRLFDEPELTGWLLDSEWIVPHLGTVKEVQESPLVLNRYQTEERLAKALEEARSAMFEGEAKAVFSRRLEAMAYYFHLDARPEAARRALAVSLALAPDRSARAVASLPFVVELTRRSFAAAHEADRKRAEEERRTSLIIKPGEAQ